MIPLSSADREPLRRIREHFRLFTVHEDVAHLDAMLEILANMEARDDPEWKRPVKVMGKEPRACVVEAMGASEGEEE